MSNARPNIIRIDSVDDERIAAYRDVRERDLVGRQGRFIAEGRVVLNVLFASSRFAAESVFLRENRLAGLENLLARVDDDVPVYVASGGIMDGIAGFHIHRGMLAVGRRKEEEGVAALLAKMPPSALVVALCSIANHDNMGAIFRNAAAFGADAVLIDQTCCDPLYRKAIRVSVGAALKVPFSKVGDGMAMVEALESNGFDIIALSPAGRTDISAVRRGRRCALLLGAEGPGLPQQLLERLPSVRISMREDFDSLNVAAASAIALHRLWQVPE